MKDEDPMLHRLRIAEVAIFFVTLFVSGVSSAQETKLINMTRTQAIFVDDEDVIFYVLRSSAGKCDKVNVDVDGVSGDRENITFPWTLVIPRSSGLYPRGGGGHKITLRGKSANCTGTISTTFHTNDVKRNDGQGMVTGLRVNDYPATRLGSLVVQGSGMCRIRVMIQPSPWNPAYKPEPPPLFKRDYDAPVQLPFVATGIGPLPDGEYTAWVIALDTNDKGEPDAEAAKKYPKYKGCFAQDNRNPRRYFVRGVTLSFRTGVGTLHAMKTTDPYVPQATPANASNSSSGSPSNGGSGAGGGASGEGILPAPKPANGNIVSMQVPGGSFAEDEAQKIQVNGHGGCGFAFTISNKSYGGSIEQTWPVLPMKLDGGAMLYNGTHFGTLAEGSWKATTTGSGGCTGSATLDFKVTAKTSTKKVTGKPTLSFDQQPKSGDTFLASKDASIWFKVTVPSSVKDEPYASCCDVEYDFLNEYGGWEALPNSPFSDSSFSLAPKQGSAVAPRSVSYFSNATRWRVKMRASKFKTEFEWSDWLQFKVDQH